MQDDPKNAPTDTILPSPRVEALEAYTAADLRDMAGDDRDPFEVSAHGRRGPPFEPPVPSGRIPCLTPPSRAAGRCAGGRRTRRGG
ncbi:hypothetical protein GCM10009535_01900 [Streptomyces thermocarboxydovorans]|uniref:Uncharacterized protein n=1 Tax=Streptomyces thermocarboxydovorans TaxID=59298 RepID=A0ABP3S9Z5_9ACTN